MAAGTGPVRASGPERSSDQAARDGAERPSFLITIDTEGDNAWGRPAPGTTKNSRYLPRFQELCERHGLRPTYLTNHEMARCPVFQDFARDALARGTCEIGMHLHAWDSPPLVPLTADDTLHHAYLIEFPRPVMRAKIDHMTKLLQDTFGRSPVSHRAGRWAFDEHYAELLVEHGYRVDCSVTPHVSWALTKGAPSGRGGTDYRGFPEDAYYLDLRDIRRPGSSALLEVPVTIIRSRHPLARLGASLRRPRRLQGALRSFWPAISWLRPTGRNGADLRRIARWGLARGRSYVEFMLHSSELMPGGSPTFKTAADIDRLHADLAALFAIVSGPYQGSTLAAFAERHAATS